jgi:hypothetical protein
MSKRGREKTRRLLPISQGVGQNYKSQSSEPQSITSSSYSCVATNEVSTSRMVNPSHWGIPIPAARRVPTVASQEVPLRTRAFESQIYPRPQSFPAPQTSAGGHGPPLSMSAYYQPQSLITPSYPLPHDHDHRSRDKENGVVGSSTIP